MNAKCEQATYISTCTYGAIRYKQQFLFIIFSSVPLRCSPMKYIFIIPEKKIFVFLFCCYFFLSFISRQFEPRKREDFSECDDCLFSLKTPSFFFFIVINFWLRLLFNLFDFLILFLISVMQHVEFIYKQIFSGHGRNCSTDYDLQIKN